MKKIIFLLSFLFVVNALNSQVGLQVNPLLSQQFSGQNSNKITPKPFLKSSISSKAPVYLKDFLLSKETIIPPTSILFQKNKTELAFFCKIESEIEQSSKIPLKFRLGEVQAVDKKEGKWKQFSN